MKKVFKPHLEAGSRESQGPRLVGSIISDMLHGWNCNTALGVNLKTLLSSDRVMRPEKEYRGVLRRDMEVDDFYYDEHYTFIGTKPLTPGKRNPRVFNGEFISVTRWDDGSLHPNFNRPVLTEEFSFRDYCLAAVQELLTIIGLLDEEAFEQ